MSILHYAAGFITCAILYTFFPSLAVKPSEWLRDAWDWLMYRNNKK